MKSLKQVILVKYGEIILKGLNRPLFEDKLISNIKKRIGDIKDVKISKAQATIYIEPNDSSNTNIIIERIKRVFGIVSITKAIQVEKDMEIIKKTAKDYLKTELSSAATFKVEAKRSDKKFPYKSPEICMEIGGYLLEGFNNLSVDVINPEVVVNVEIRDFYAFIYSTKIKGTGGMPIGTSGKATLLLSGGIDSPVAGYMIAKRGVVVNAVHFFSYPYTSERAKDKVISLAKILASYTGEINLHIVPFTDIQLKIKENCKSEHLTLIMRRYMMKISEIIAKNSGSLALITGESLGQVASQTLESLCVTDVVVDMPIFRPLIGMDKDEIVSIARKIETYETSILPYEDCCTVFTPKHPTTKPKLYNIENSESLLQIDDLVKKAVDETEVLIVK